MGIDKKNSPGEFVIRVYGILINDENEVLLSDEYRFGMHMTKFPGGGLKFGEGPEDCIRREAIEELGQPVEIISHFYTTGFYQEAMFFENHQLISIYYRIRLTGPAAFRVSEKVCDFSGPAEGSQSFRWKKIGDLTDADLTFPIDRFVGRMLTGIYRKGAS